MGAEREALSPEVKIRALRAELILRRAPPSRRRRLLRAAALVLLGGAGLAAGTWLMVALMAMPGLT